MPKFGSAGPSLPIELAIHKMTGATARELKFKDRGLLQEGYRVNVVIFDPTDFQDRATFDAPHQFPTGALISVIVKDKLVVEDAAHIGALPGTVLKRHRSGTVS